MAFEALDPLAAIWRRAGLRYVLVPEELRLRPASGQPAAPVARSWRKTQPQAQTPRPARPEHGQQAEARRAVEWPASWKEQLGLARKGRVAWTYWQLGPDLLAARNPQAPQDEGRARRGQLLRKIIGSLGHKPGTHTLWPMLLSEQPEPELFWAGFSELGCRYGFVFGEKAALALTGQTAMANFALWRDRGRIIWRLPEIDAIDDAAFARMIAFIRNSLAPLRLD